MSYSTCRLCGHMLVDRPGSACTNRDCLLAAEPTQGKPLTPEMRAAHNARAPRRRSSASRAFKGIAGGRR